jgi:hypothetical protein
MSLPSKEQLLETAFRLLEDATAVSVSALPFAEMKVARARQYIELAREVPDTKAKDRPFRDVADL